MYKMTKWAMTARENFLQRCYRKHLEIGCQQAYQKYERLARTWSGEGWSPSVRRPKPCVYFS
jgi:hypothetical protein